MRKCFIDTLIECAKNDDSVVLLMAEVGYSVVEPFEKMFPERFFNTGIAEQNLVLTAAGMALRGMHPVAYSMSSFLASRAFEQIKISVCYQNLPVVLVSVGSGLSYGEMGSTHHAIEESSILRSLPNLKVLYPGNKIELKKAIECALGDNCPYFISYPKAVVPEYNDYCVEIGRAVKHRSGCDAAILAFGYSINAAIIASDELLKYNKKVSVYGFHTVKPLDQSAILEAASTGKIFVLDEHNYCAGIGAEVARVILENGRNVRTFRDISIPDCFEEYIRRYDEMAECYGLTSNRVIEEVLKF